MYFCAFGGASQPGRANGTVSGALRYSYALFFHHVLHRYLGMRENCPHLYSTHTRQCLVFRSVRWLGSVVGRRNMARVGSRYYKAPELLVGFRFYDYAVDIFS